MSLSGINYISETPLDRISTFALLNANIPTRLSQLLNDADFIKNEPSAFSYCNLSGAPCNVSSFCNDSKYIQNAANAFSYCNLKGAPCNVSSFCNDAGYITNALGGFTAANLAGCNIFTTFDPNAVLKVTVGNYLGIYDPQFDPNQAPTGPPTTTITNTPSSHTLYPNISVSASNVIGSMLPESVMPAYLQPTKVFQNMTYKYNVDSVSFYDVSGQVYTNFAETSNFTCNFTYSLPNVLIPASNLIGNISACNVQNLTFSSFTGNEPTCNTYSLNIEQPPYNYYGTALNNYIVVPPTDGNGTTRIVNDPGKEYVNITGNSNMANVYVQTSFRFLKNTGISACNLTDTLPLTVLPSFLKPTISYDVFNLNGLQADLGGKYNDATLSGYAMRDYILNVMYPGMGEDDICALLFINNINDISSIEKYQRNFTDERSMTMRFSLGGFKNFQADYISTYGVATSSDARIKKNVVPLNSNASLSVIAGLEPVGYRFIQDNTSHHGFIAQSVSKVLPEAVSLGSGKVPGNKEEVADFNYIDYAIITTHSVGAIQALKAEVDALKNRVASLEGLLG